MSFVKSKNNKQWTFYLCSEKTDAVCPNKQYDNRIQHKYNSYFRTGMV